MSVIERARNHIADIKRRFPSETAVFTRRGVDQYNQPTDAAEPVGTATVWRRLPELPEKRTIDISGQTYADDKDIWIEAIWAPDLPDVRRDDVCTLEDGVPRIVRNIQNRMNIRVLWQLSEGV
jgi:hypothetical protein